MNAFIPPRRMLFFRGGGGAFPTHASDFIHGSFFRRSPSLTILLAFFPTIDTLCVCSRVHFNGFNTGNEDRN